MSTKLKNKRIKLTVDNQAEMKYHVNRCNIVRARNERDFGAKFSRVIITDDNQEIKIPFTLIDGGKSE